MPRKIDTPIIVARYGDKVAGWAGDNNGGRLSGDAEWVDSAQGASDAGVEFTLYNGIELKADITDPNNPAGAFAALAWYAKERILIKTAPEGMMASLGLLDIPEDVDPFEGYDGEVTEEDRQFMKTHVNLTIDGEEVWVPLAKIQSTGSSPALLNEFLKSFATEDEEPVQDDTDDVQNNSNEEGDELASAESPEGDDTFADASHQPAE